MPAPSARTNPSRSLSKGREARVGSSSVSTARDRREARDDQGMDEGVGPPGEHDVGVAALDRLRLRRRTRAGWRGADGRVVRALRPSEIAICPLAASARTGRDEERRGPSSAALRMRSQCAHEAGEAPHRRPDDDAHPGVVVLDCAPGPGRHRRGRAMSTLRSMRRTSSRGHGTPDRSPESLAAISGMLEASNAWIQPIPLRPATADSQVDWASSPSWRDGGQTQ